MKMGNLGMGMGMDDALQDHRVSLGLLALIAVVFVLWKMPLSSIAGLQTIRIGGGSGSGAAALRAAGLGGYESIGIYLTDNAHTRAYWGIIIYPDPASGQASYIKARSPDQYASPQARLYVSTRTAAALAGLEPDPDKVKRHAERNTAQFAEAVIQATRQSGAGIRVEPAELARFLGKEPSERGAGGSQPQG